MCVDIKYLCCLISPTHLRTISLSPSLPLSLPLTLFLPPHPPHLPLSFSSPFFLAPSLPLSYNFYLDMTPSPSKQCAHTHPQPRKNRSTSVILRRSSSRFSTTTTASGMPVLEDEPMDRHRSLALRDVSLYNTAYSLYIHARTWQAWEWVSSVVVSSCSQRRGVGLIPTTLP